MEEDRFCLILFLLLSFACKAEIESPLLAQCSYLPEAFESVAELLCPFPHYVTSLTLAGRAHQGTQACVSGYTCAGGLYTQRYRSMYLKNVSISCRDGSNHSFEASRPDFQVHKVNSRASGDSLCYFTDSYGELNL